MKTKSLFKIEYLGVEFEVYKIESKKMYIQDEHGNPLGFVFVSDDYIKIKEVE